MKKNATGAMMQYFEWYLPKDCGLWNKVKNEAAELAEKGITALWLPPAYKGLKGNDEVGYAVYDLFDLGEFDQKESVRTKYGTKDEYLAAIKACHDAGIQVYADIVLNHKVEGDDYETVRVIEYDWNDRNVQISGEKTIRALSKFYFPGRNGEYNSFIWDKTHFSGSDTNERNKRRGIYQFSGTSWSQDVDDENGNFDYLLGLNINFSNPDVISHLLDWGEWYLNFTGIDGFRLDALKHIDKNFFPAWLQEMRHISGKELFTVGEYWKGDVSKLKAYLESVDNCMSLFDVPLHYAFQNISNSNGLYDLSQILNGTLTSVDPLHSVTFVDNHDTQPGQALESCVQEWFLPHAYSIILLRPQGYPCIFYGDYYGLDARDRRNCQKPIDAMLKLRKTKLFGEQHDYFDDFDVIGWTLEGDKTHKDSGLAVIMSDKDAGEKNMFVGTQHAGEVWTDKLSSEHEPVTIKEDGTAVFRCDGGSVSCYSK